MGELKDYEINQVHGNFAITIPRSSEQYDGKNRFKNKVWQCEPPRRGVGALFESVAVAINISGHLAGVDFLARDIVQVSKGKKCTEKQKEHVIEYFKREGIEQFKGHKFRRTETLDKEITVDTYFFPIHLAIMYKN